MSLLDRLGLGRRELRAWAMYDWANSAFQTTIIAAVFPIYFQKVAAAGQPEAVAMSRFAWATTIAILIVAIVAPLLGAIADYTAIKKRLLAVFVAIGATAAAGMFWIGQGDWQLALTLFVIGNVGVAGSIVFYESLLPHLVGEKELDRVSSAGYAIGYLGGGVLLAINLLMIQQPAMFGIPDAGVATRLALASVARLVGRCSRFRCSGASRSRRAARARRAAGRQRLRHRRADGCRRRSTSCAATGSVHPAARVPALQRRHPDDDQDGDDLRHRHRPRPRAR